MDSTSIYTVGGTVQAGRGVYIKRKADDELMELCRRGELAFILSSRQVGKSSLMTRTAKQLEKEDIRSAIIDLSSIGAKVTQDEWYLGLLNEISTQLNLDSDIFAWWTQYAALGAAQRFFNFLRDIMLKEIRENIVLFFDEIDTTLSMPFTDDFFASLRAVFNARSTTPDFKRLSFVLIGVATPSDLISDNKRTPFNIGRRVDLKDFSVEDAMPLAQGLGENAVEVLTWILEWSNGHPYLTQRMCAYLSESNKKIDEQVVADAVETLFLKEQGGQDNNLQFVRDMLVKRSPDSRRVMTTYEDIRSGKRVVDDEQSIVKAHLKISGIVKKHSGQLVTRNRIYTRVFDPKWIIENTPSAVPPRIMFGSIMVVLLVLLIGSYSTLQEINRTDEERATRFETAFKTTNDPQTRLENLAGIFKLEDKSFVPRAKVLFNSLTQKEKLSLFKPNDSKSVRGDQQIVILGLYRELINSPDENELLKAMSQAMKAYRPELADEIKFWEAGREAMLDEKYDIAEVNFNYAVNSNMKNPVLYHDRAQLYILMGEEKYGLALSDLDMMITLDPNSPEDVVALINKDVYFLEYWNKNIDQYPDLAEFVLPVRCQSDLGSPETCQ